MKKWTVVIKQRLASRGFDEKIEANFEKIESALVFMEMVMQSCEDTRCELICANVESEEEAND